MKLITFTFLLTSLCFAQAPAAAPAATPQPEKFPISAEYMTLFNGLIQNIQAVQKQVQAAEEKLRGDICKEKAIPLADCNVDWQTQTVSKKVAVAPKPPEKK